MIDMHPPANKRCQIYTTGEWNVATGNFHVVSRCSNDGNHWEKWGGCHCGNPDRTFCESDFFSWECTGGHVFLEVTEC